MAKKSSGNWLESCLRSLAKARVAVFGDFCIDAYWLIDGDSSELSVETGLPVRKVRSQRYSLGGAGNVVANLVDLGVAQVHAVGLVGNDLFGRLMLDMLAASKVDTKGLLSSQADWQTMVYAKPYLGDDEQNRLDFGAFNVISPGRRAVSPASIDALARELDRVAAVSDAVILNQQIPAGVSTPEMIARINDVIARRPDCKFLVDSRHRSALYKGAMLKLNSHAAAALCDDPRPPADRIPDDDARSFAECLFAQTNHPVFVTRGEYGMLTADADGIHDVPGIQILERVDPVGAGDAVISAIAAVMGTGGDSKTAAAFANIAASITVRKLHTTGTASPAEIRKIGPMPDYIYLPEIADDPRRARIIDNTEIEIVRDLPQKLSIRHAVFDHDGTISTLREGWERIMEPMMIRAILGPRYDDAGEALYHKVVAHVRQFISKTTGIQTLVQMQGLVELVRQYGCVTESDVLDEHGYKAVYNDALLAMVRQRVAKLDRRELDPADFHIKGVLELLKRLHDKGVKLYLASGTDTADVLAEAKALGYAGLFEGRIFGAVGDVKVEAKKLVLERIFTEHGLSGSQLITFGDGPVEMRETRKRDGIAVGVASDEVRRFGLSPVKRTRLIRAGADIIIPDFSQLDRLLPILGL
jgi:rfaE bifunctional protein kinase chain/domain